MPKDLEVISRFKQYEDFNQLPSNLQSLVEKASNAAQNAHAPYSNFKVGAVLLDEKGDYHSGSNQENAAYPSGMCAERVALFAAYSKNPDVQIKTLAVVAIDTNGVVPAPPCGSCRQTILECEVRQNTPIQIVICYNKGTYLVADSIEDLLPLSFSNKHLGV